MTYNYYSDNVKQMKREIDIEINQQLSKYNPQNVLANDYFSSCCACFCVVFSITIFLLAITQ